MPFPMRQLRREEFPALLQEIPDCPKKLYIRGALPPPETTLLCVVGSRMTSVYGQRMTHQLIAGLSKHPVAIVSGLALGIDAEAHKAALDVGLPTIAMVPSSADEASLYPSSNRPLAHRILARGGAILSEQEELSRRNQEAPRKPAARKKPCVGSPWEDSKRSAAI